MISPVDATNFMPGEWRVSEFEHELRLRTGEVVDLKASYGLDVARIGIDWFELEMSETPGSPPLTLRWEELSRFDSLTTGPIVPAEDGRVGLIGVRLLVEPSSVLQFEIELDWLRVQIACLRFVVMGSTGSSY